MDQWSKSRTLLDQEQLNVLLKCRNLTQGHHTEPHMLNRCCYKKEKDRLSCLGCAHEREARPAFATGLWCQLQQVILRMLSITLSPKLLLQDDYSSAFGILLFNKSCSLTKCKCVQEGKMASSDFYILLHLSSLDLSWEQSLSRCWEEKKWEWWTEGQTTGTMVATKNLILRKSHLCLELILTDCLTKHVSEDNVYSLAFFFFSPFISLYFTVNTYSESNAIYTGSHTFLIQLYLDAWRGCREHSLVSHS